MKKKSVNSSLQGSSSNIFGLFSFQSVLDHLKFNPTFIDLSDCDMKFCTPSQWVQLGDGLQRCVALDELIISSNAIFSANKEKYQAACQAIAQAQKVKKLDLSHNFTSMQTYDMWAAIGRLINSFPYIEELSLRGSCLGKLDKFTPDIKRIYREITQTFSALSSIKIIDLRYNSLAQLPPNILNNIFIAILTNKNIQEVKLIDDENDVNSNKISDFSDEQNKYYDSFKTELSKRLTIVSSINEDEKMSKRGNQLVEDERIIFEQLKTQVQKTSEQTMTLNRVVETLQAQKLNQMSTIQIREKLNSVLRNSPNVLLYYKIVNIKLEEIFIGIKAASSTILPNQIQGDLSGLSNTVNVVGTILSYLPWVGNALKNISELTRQQLNKIDNERCLNLLRHLSTLGTLEEVTILSEKISRYLTISYFSQIQEMKAGSEIEKDLSIGKACGTLFENVSEQIMEYGKKTYKYITGIRSKEPTYALAEYSVMLILSALISDKVDINKPLLPQISDIVSKQPKKKTIVLSEGEKLIGNPIKHILRLLFDEKTIQTKSGRLWILEMIFCKPGIQTNTGYYTSRDLDPEKYGYRWCFENLSNRQDLRALAASDYFSQGLISQFHKDLSDQGLVSDITPIFEKNVKSSYN